MYEPAEDSFLLKDCILDYCSTSSVKNVLDMGTGSGIQAFSVVDKVEFVLAVDVDKDAISHIKAEIINKGLSSKLEVIHSDLFEDVPHRFHGSFDLMIFNAPYLPKGEDDYEDTELYGGAHGVHVTENFLTQSVEYLSENGVIFFVASSLAKLEFLENHMNKLNFKFEVVKKEHISFEDIIVYKAWF